MNWTAQQLAAIDSRNKNLLVAAAAGSGKTAVLVERIINLVVDGGLDVDRMLIVTFTNAAAWEMRSRIHKAILDKLTTANDSEIIARLERQSVLLSNATITTFHSFCLSILKRHFAKIDFDPKFREASEQELNILKQEVIEDLFELKYSTDSEFAKFTDDFDGNVHGDTELHKLIIGLNDFSKSRPDPEGWLNSLAEVYRNPDTTKLDGNMNWLDFMMIFAMDRARNYITESGEDCLLNIRIAAEFKFKLNCLNSDLILLNRLNAVKNDWDLLYEELRCVDFQRMATIRPKTPDAMDAKEDIKRRRDEYKSKIKHLRDKVITMPLAEIIREMQEVAPSVAMLARTTLDFDAAFTLAKRERGIIDFDDMEHLALKILNTDSHTAELYREKFNIIMVDEYQDTNGVQEELIGKIVGQNNLFAVGDVKQSIYRFRNADPEIFMRKYDEYPKLDNSARIDLSQNFRSRRRVVDAVNAIFKPLMTREAMEIEYDENAQLNFGAEYYPDGENIFDERAEFCIIDAAQVDADSDDDSLTDIECEMTFIANKIKAMMSAGKQVWDSDHYRNLEFRDIVILVRSVDKIAAQIVNALGDNDIPAYAADKDGYFQAVEIQTIMSLLNILDNTRQDIPLATVMLSPIGGFCAEDLARLRIGNRDADLFTLIDDSDDIRYKNFLAKIDRWREIARQISVPELLSTIYRETGCYDYFGKTYDGKIAQANLRMLIDRAADYERTAFRGLSRFIQYIKKIRNLGNDLSAARTLGESENVVRVMTIHKSKGLEFPVVFVARLGKRFNMKDLNATIIAHRDLGVGVYKTSAGGSIRVPTFARQIIAQKARLEMLAEELRILYVAFTRAKEKLILVGMYRGGVSETENISAYRIQNVRSPLDWLMMIKGGVADTIDVTTVAVEDVGKIAIEIPAEEIPAVKTSEGIDKIQPSPLDNIPAKLTVTEIKRRILKGQDLAESIDDVNLYSKHAALFAVPSFIQAVKPTAAEIGTLIHSVMQHLDLRGRLDRAGISAQIDEMVMQQLLTSEQRDAIRPRVGNIAEFFGSAIGRSIINSPTIYRELPFNMYIDAGSINAGEIFRKAAGEKIFVQGIIDLLFVDDAGNWILLDYKTDRDDSDEHFQREYREQVNLYARAVETVANVKVSGRYLYLLSANRLVDMAQ